MSRALRVLCQYLFENLKLNKITAHTFADNIASQRVLQKNGFVQEGYLKKHYLKNNHFKDANIYSLLSAK